MRFVENMTDADLLLELMSRGRLTNVECSVLNERAEQREKGYTVESDAGYTDGVLVDAALAYLKTAEVAFDLERDFMSDGDAAGLVEEIRGDTWPWPDAEFKPRGRVDDLRRAAALIIAELERLEHAAKPS